MKLAASQPSTTRWSQLSDRFMRLRTSISPSSGTSFSSTLLTARIATSGRLISGVGGADAVHHPARVLERGDVIFLDQGEMRDPPFRLLHVLGDLAAQANDLDGLVLARSRRAAGNNAAIVKKVRVQVRMPDAIRR